MLVSYVTHSLTWRWMRNISSTRLLTFNGLHGIISKNIGLITRRLFTVTLYNPVTHCLLINKYLWYSVLHATLLVRCFKTICGDTRGLSTQRIRRKHPARRETRKCDRTTRRILGAQNTSTAVSTNSFKIPDDDHWRSKHVVYKVVYIDLKDSLCICSKF
jgi:hypothetical protein